MSVDNTDNKWVIIRSPTETPKQSSQPDAATLYYSSSPPITASKYALSPSAALPAALTSFYKSNNNIESIQ